MTVRSTPSAWPLPLPTLIKELGGEIVSEQAVNVGDTDMRPVLTTIAAASPEFIYYPIFTAEAGFVTSQAKEVPGLENVKLGAADGSFSQDFVNAAGDAAQGMYLSSPDFSAFGDAVPGNSSRSMKRSTVSRR